jgi:hypothetical protein
MSYAYKNLLTPINTDSGIADFALIAPVRDFVDPDGIKCPAAPFTDPGDEVKIKQNHAFKDGKAFAKYILAPETNQLQGTTVGDLGFRKMDQTATIVIPGSYAELHEAAKNLLNVPLIVLLKDSNCPANMYYQLGCDCVYAWASNEFGTGTTRDGRKGYTITINYLQGYIQLYAGTVSVLSDDSSSS